ncbi:MAG: hypothetical protein ACRDZX_13570 [Acidimicrobiales bacterium]
MLVLGSLLALVSGTLNSAAAALEKHQGMRTPTEREGMSLLAALAKRPLWLFAIGMSGLAWVLEAAALASAPVPVVATLRIAGRGLLVVGGGRWLDERFTVWEVLGVALASAGGAITAAGASHVRTSHKPLSNLTELMVGAGCVLSAILVSRGAAWLAGTGRRGAAPSGRSTRRTKAGGVAMGAAVGVLFAGSGVFTKEIGDRFAVYGVGGLTSVAASAGLWLMIAMSVWAQSLIQRAFRRANAATVSAANATVASLGLIASGFLLYGENLPRGLYRFMLVGGIVVAIVGTVLLIGSRPGTPAAGAGAGARAAAESNAGGEGVGDAGGEGVGEAGGAEMGKAGRRAATDPAGN